MAMTASIFVRCHTYPRDFRRLLCLNCSPAARINAVMIETRSNIVFTSAAPSHLMTLSALARTLGGIVRPICLPSLD